MCVGSNLPLESTPIFMHQKPEYKIGIISDRPIRIYKYDEELLRKRAVSCPYFLDRFEVARIINRKTETLDSFISARNSKKSIARYSYKKQRDSKSNDLVGALTTVTNVVPVTFEEAALYWFQFAIIGNSLALQISRYIIEKPLEKIAAEVYWKKAITDKQLQIQEAVKIVKQEETIINKSFLANKKGEAIYTLNGTIEKARTIMQLDSTTDALRIIESGVAIQHTKNQVVRLMAPVISKEIHDEIIDVANRYRFIDSD